MGQSNLNLIKSVSLSRIRTKNGNYVPVDIDVSPMDNSNTKKEAVGWTYRCFDGYSPIFSYIGTEGSMLDCELRPGQQNCQKGTPEFLRNTMRMVTVMERSGRTSRIGCAVDHVGGTEDDDPRPGGRGFRYAFTR